MEKVNLLTIAEIVRLASIPVGKCYWSAVGQPKEATLISQIRARCPKMFISKAFEKW